MSDGTVDGHGGGSTAGASGAVRVEPLPGAGDGVAVLTVDRPPLNILDLATLDELGAALEELAALPRNEAPRVLLVRGGGERAFSAGVAVEDHTPERIGPMLERFHGALRSLRALPTVSVAVVRGHCLGGGMELAAACDLVVAGEGARFGQPEVDLGCYPPYAAALYPALLGERRTLDLLLTGRTLDAAEAERIGFASRVVPDGELDDAASELAAGLAAKSGAVTRLIRRAVRAGDGHRFERALAECERIYLEDLAATDDMREGIDAFLEKRSPDWRHR